MRWLFSVLVLVSMATAPANEKKDAAALQILNAQLASGALDQAGGLEAYVAKATGDDAALLKACAKLAAEEAENWSKSSEAFGKNQIRQGEKFAEKAVECAEKRGENGQAVADILAQIDANDPEKAQRQAEFERLKAEREKLLQQK